MTEFERKFMEMTPEQRKIMGDQVSASMGYMGPYIPEIHDKHRKEKVQKD